MTTTRLRKTFKYPSDNDSDDLASDLDETEQETLLTNLSDQESANNALYVKAFTFLPLATIPAFVYYLFSSRSYGPVRMLCLLAITSLGATGMGMWFVPYSDPAGSEKKRSGSVMSSRVRKVPGLDLELDDDGPIGRVLPWLNAAICALLVLAAWGLKGRRDVPEEFWIFLTLPAVILGIVVTARQSMKEVEQGIGELGKMRYDYKGA